MGKKVLGLILMGLLVVFVLGCKESKAPEKVAEQDTVDYGQQPFVLDIEEATIENDYFRIAKWTGNSLQLTLMSIEVGGEVGLEKHEGLDQFIRVDKGKAKVLMGKTQDDLSFEKIVSDDWAILIPGGYWHNIINIGDEELKLYSIYSPPEHPAGTIHATFEDSEADEHH
ncbi:MAG: cupin domain-containing protein [Candidatus Neomarinimicrobiota bacterium]